MVDMCLFSFKGEQYKFARSSRWCLANLQLDAVGSGGRDFTHFTRIGEAVLLEHCQNFSDGFGCTCHQQAAAGLRVASSMCRASEGSTSAM